MELWIRSQDRSQLIKANNLWIDYFDSAFPRISTGEDVKTVAYIIKNDDIEIASSDTDKRALEVLNEIHQRLIDMQSIEIMKDITLGMKKRGVDCVYETPEE